MYQLKSGNVFLLDEHQNWITSTDTRWNHENYLPREEDRYLGQRFIDGMVVCVFKCIDKRLRAQLETIARIGVRARN
jgi:hypothetical protein